MAAPLREHINQLTKDYNVKIDALEREFDIRTSSMRRSEKRQLRTLYSHHYLTLQNQFKAERNTLVRQFVQENPSWGRARKLWGWLFIVVTIAAIGCCGASLPTDDHQPAQGSQLTSQTEVTYWNVENIPIPYLQDATQYVSNPDNVLSQQAVDSINVNMKKIEDEFDIQSVVIIVNRVENGDPYRLAQDVGNRYGVGRNDRGLMVVVAYEDHKINISPGLALEGDLTDAECRQLQQRYVIPGMKAEQPDSAMIYLAKGLYSHLKGKEMPQMSNLLDSNEDEGFGQIGLTFCFLIVCFIVFVYKNKEYMWIPAGTVTLLANPFIEQVVITSGGGFGGGHSGFGGGGGFSGGGFSGGSFGGGSFGGGGATSSW
jgi:uncharacterized membrane protein YgcG